MEQRIEKLATNLNELISEEYVTPQEIYEELGKIFTNHSEYFAKTINASVFLKLVLYIYSQRAFGDMSGGERMYNEGFFANLLTTDKTPSSIECEDCGGSGEVTCDDCEGDGSSTCYECNGKGEVSCDVCDGNETIECENCDGTGEVDEDEECSDCNGSGEITCGECEGKGSKTCSDCEGDGYRRCDECYGDGNVSCSECSGDGQVESEDKIDFTEYAVFSWDKDLKNLCELRVDTVQPVMGKIDFFNKMNVITLRTWDEQEVPTIEFDEDSVYCFNFTTSIEEASPDVVFRGRKSSFVTFHNTANFYYY